MESNIKLDFKSQELRPSLEPLAQRVEITDAGKKATESS
jgi:hypothetical protein